MQAARLQNLEAYKQLCEQILA